MPRSRDEKPDTPRFAVTWDGLVYPVAEMGQPTDLKADVDTLASKLTAEVSRYRHRKPTFVGWLGMPAEEFPYAYDRPRNMREWSESELVSCNSLLAIKSCLLLRLGKVQLAGRVWDKWRSRDAAVLGLSSKGDDPYLVFAWEWGWALFHRAVGAHIRGDDVIAMQTAKTLVPFANAVPRVAAQRGFQQITNIGSNTLIPFMPLRDPPARLLEESTRRVKARSVRGTPDIESARSPDQRKRIAALIGALENVSAGPEYAKGCVPIGPPRISYMPSGHEQGPPVNPLKASPVVQALITEGNPAVEPLLECLVNDCRLTRVVGSSPSTCGDFLPAHDFIGVDVAAYMARMRHLEGRRLRTFD